MWGIPRMPHYQDWIPYGFTLGGIALVVLYLSFGLGSLGIFGLVSGGMGWGTTDVHNQKTFRVGLTTFFLAIGLVWGYMKLMELTWRLW